MNIQVNYRSELWKLLNENSTVAEIGVAEGRFSKTILSWGMVEKLYLVDAWQQLPQAGDGGYAQEWHTNNLKEVHERIEGNEDKVIILQGLSTDMAANIPDNSLDMVYIDANHSYDGCLKDLNAYYPKVKINGFICGHDILNESYGVRKAVEQFCIEHGYEEINIIPDEEPVMASFWIKKI